MAKMVIYNKFANLEKFDCVQQLFVGVSLSALRSWRFLLYDLIAIQN